MKRRTTTRGPRGPRVVHVRPALSCHWPPLDASRILPRADTCTKGCAAIARTLFVIKIGTTFPDTARRYGDFDAWVGAGLDASAGAVQVVDAEHGAPLPEPADCAGVVLTGSHAMVTDRLEWSVRVGAWLPSLVAERVPFLGICYGHQLLADAMGGEVGYLPRGLEIGTVEIDLLPDAAGDALFRGVPPRFPAHAAHAQTVVTLPPGAVRLAASAFDPNHAFRLGPCAWGVQFHPEYDTRVMAAYIREEADDCRRAGWDVAERLRTVRETPAATALLRRFAEIAQNV